MKLHQTLCIAAIIATAIAAQPVLASGSSSSLPPIVVGDKGFGGGGSGGDPNKKDSPECKAAEDSFDKCVNNSAVSSNTNCPAHEDKMNGWCAQDATSPNCTSSEATYINTCVPACSGASAAKNNACI